MHSYRIYRCFRCRRQLLHEQKVKSVDMHIHQLSVQICKLPRVVAFMPMAEGGGGWVQIPIGQWAPWSTGLNLARNCQKLHHTMFQYHLHYSVYTRGVTLLDLQIVLSHTQSPT